MADAQRGRGPAAPPPVGVVYNTGMSRPDAALALAMLHAMADQRLARVGSVCVTGAGLETAIFCDMVGRVFVPGERNGNQALAVGLALMDPMPADPPMIRPAVARKKPTGEPEFIRGIKGVADTSQAEAVLRNGVLFNAESVVVLSAPATTLARTLDLAGARDEYARRVKRLVIADTDSVRQDAAGLQRILAEWPSPVVVCPRDVGIALSVSTEVLDQAFSKFTAHPVVDAYRAFSAPPYDVPLHDLAAVHYAVRPDDGFFTASASGTLSVGRGGVFVHTPGPGTGQLLSLAAGKDAEARAVLITLASAAPQPPAARGRSGDD